MTKKICITSALCTPLTEDEKLDEAGLAVHLADQWSAGVRSVFVAGSMGVMQLLTDAVYRRLVETTVQLANGGFEVLVGVGDTGYARTRERIEFAADLPIAGVVAITPYFLRFSQEELLDYFRSLADIARVPLYLYDLPAVTGTKLTLETVAALAAHPNIAGIKCSGDVAGPRQLHDLLGPTFRVVMAQPDVLDALLRHGLTDHLDGMYAVAPHWTMSIVRAAEVGDWDTAAQYQRQLSALKRVLLAHGMHAFTVFLNARGMPGNCAPKPTRRLSQTQAEVLLQEPIVQEYVRQFPARAEGRKLR